MSATVRKADRKLRIVADIGGTQARFAQVDGNGRVGEPSVWLTSLFPSFGDALQQFLTDKGDGAEIGAIAVCGAGPLSNGAIQFTNCPWTIDVGSLADASGVADPVLVNDFTAVALSLPHLEQRDLVKLGGGTARPDAPIGVLGAGTGLGVSGLIPCGTGYVPLSGEGGHVSLAPSDAREVAICYQMLMQRGHVSAESVLSGPGLEFLYSSIAASDGVPLESIPTAADITRAAREGSSEVAAETVTLFTGWLGAVAGDLALTLGAKGGIYIAGGIVPRLGELFDAALFRHRFEAKGRFRDYLAEVPCWLITAENPALRGLASLLPPPSDQPF